MILTCPACGTRYQADEAKFPPDGRMVRCAKCSHVWHQAGLSGAPEPDVAIIAPEPPPKAAAAASRPGSDFFADRSLRAQACGASSRARAHRLGRDAGRGGRLDR